MLVLTDVPASFVIVPPALAAAAAPLIAQPPLPPSGAYRFGDVRVVGLARREDEPTLREVWQRFPDIRFVRLRPVPERPDHRPRRHRRDAGGRSTPRASTTATMTGKIDRLGAWIRARHRHAPVSARPAWSRVEDDSVMQWPVVELAEWEELRQCPDCGRLWLASGPRRSRAG